MKWFVGSLLVLCMLFQAVSWQQSLGQAEPPECPCHLQGSNYSSLQMLGAMECAHGPNHNAECRALQEFVAMHPGAGPLNILTMCHETNGGKDITVTDPATGDTGTFACKCYECGQPDQNGDTNQCEGFRLFNEAMCGLLGTGTQGNCVRHDSVDEQVPAIEYPVAYTSNNLPCDYTNGFEVKDKCEIDGQVGYSCLQP